MIPVASGTVYERERKPRASGDDPKLVAEV